MEQLVRRRLTLAQGHLQRAFCQRVAHLLAAGSATDSVCLWDVSVRVWEMRSQTQRHLLSGHTNWVFNIAISPDGNLLASASTDESIRLWDLTTYTCIKILHPPGPYDAMQISGVTGISEGQRATLHRLGARG